MIHDRIINFLKDKAWEEVFQATNKKWQAPSSVAKFCVLSPPKELGLPERWNLSIPVNPDTIDYEDFIATRIKVIADIYGVSIEYIQNQIFASKDTVLSIRIYDEETSEGTIAFTRFENLMEGVKKILVDTASFVLETKNGFENQNEIAQQYLSRCAFLQTEKGSFIANIQLPSETTIEDMTSQKQLIPSKEINDKLNDVLTFVSKEILVEDKDKVSDEFIKQNEDKINIALLRDIKEFYASAGIKNVDFSGSR